MSPQVLEEIITSFWEYQATRKAEKEEDLSVDELLYQFLLTRNESNETGAIEDGYNLQEAWGRCSFDPYVQLFIHIITKEAKLDIINKWISTQVQIMERFKKISPGKVTKSSNL